MKDLPNFKQNELVEFPKIPTKYLNLKNSDNNFLEKPAGDKGNASEVLYTHNSVENHLQLKSNIKEKIEKVIL